MKSESAALLVAGLVAAGCGGGGARSVHAGPPDSSGASAFIAGTDSGGRPVFTRRVDADVTDLLPLRDPAFGESLLALTGFAGGEDQCRLLVLSSLGVVLASHRVQGQSPLGEPGHRQLQRPLPGTVRTYEAGGRRFLAVATTGWWAPHSVEVLEILRGRLVPRLEVWNNGSHSHYAIGEGHLAFLGLNNGFRPPDVNRYGLGIGLVDLQDLPAGDAPGGPRVVVLPSGTDPGRGFRWYALLPETHGVVDSQILPPVFEKGFLRVPMERGVTYRFRIEDGTGGVEESRILRPPRPAGR